VFPPDNPWNQDVSSAPVDPNSARLIAAIGANDRLHADFGTVYRGAPNGIPYIVVSGTQPSARVNLTSYASESDPGPYPIPRDAPIEGGPNSEGDRHVIVIDRDKWKLYELFSVRPNPVGTIWTAGAGAIFDLKSNALRPDGWTSAMPRGCRFFQVSFVTTRFSSSVRFATLCVLPCSVPGVPMFIPRVIMPGMATNRICRRWECGSV
jgi:hypothetical protein